MGSRGRGKPRAGRTSAATREQLRAEAPRPQAPNSGKRALKSLALGLALFAVTLAAYWPALHGGLLWDDDKHITRQELRSVDGLRRIWFEPGSTQQYYPVVHSAFWLEHRLWGDATLGYHVVNTCLHALSALLIWAILRRLAVPGASLAAFLFALHPIQVESVAWITELKNTLSGVFYFAAALAYLRFDRTRRATTYAVALALFVLALLSKTVTGTLPASLAVVLWWRHGTLDIRRDLRPLVPLIVLGVAGGFLTAWVERVQIGAYGSDFQFSLIDRCLIAGRVAWFYLGKLTWPTGLAFIYPRWTVSSAEWWQYLFPLALAGLLGALWWLRSRTRAPLAVLLLYCLALVPAAGFVNVYPFRFAFVADHFQYLAGVPVFALAAAAAMTLAKRINAAPVRFGAAAALAVALGGLTWEQSREYGDAETLYRTTIARNPSCWMARINLGTHLLASAPELAAVQFEEAVRLKPDLPEAHFNLGIVDEKAGRLDEAAAHYRMALQHGPDLAVIHNNVGHLLMLQGRPKEAAEECTRALRLDPGLVEAHVNLGALALGTDNARAEAHFRAAVALRPGVADYHNQLADALQVMGRLDEARAEYESALRLRPDFPEAHNNLGSLLRRGGKTDAAIEQFRAAIRAKPDFANAHYYLGNALMDLGKPEEAAAEFRLALSYSPDDAAARNNLGVAFEALGRLAEAAEQFRLALKLRPSLQEARESLARVSSARRGDGRDSIR